MDLFDRFRRRQTNRRKPASRRDQRQLCVETLESRVLLAAAPAIFVITHGFQFSTSDNASLPQWSADVENAINSVLQKSYPDLQKDFVTENWATVSDQIGPYGRDFAAQDIESKIDRMMTEHNWIQADLFFVGHSRGAIVNTQVIQELGSDARFDRIEMVMLDPTAALPMLDNLVNPALVPSSVDRARNYDDGHPLAPPLTYDGFSLHAEQSNTVIVSSDVGDIIDSYIGEASVLDYFLREPAAIAASRILSTLAFGTDKPIQALAAGNEYRHSYKSHSAIDDWYVSSRFLDSDVRTFLSSKDPLDIGSVIIGELPSSGNESGKVPVGRGDSPALTARGLDDHANAFGSAATVIQIGQTKPGSIETTGDHDWFQFRARTNGPILIEVIPLDGKPTPYARFHWDNKTLITQDTGGGSGGIATIRYKNAEAGRNYFLDVSGAAGTKGSYLVRVTQPSQVADDPADQTPPSGPIVDDFPDTKAAAHSLVLDSSGSAATSGAIKSPLDNTDDVDWFQFVANRTGLLTVDMSTPNSSLDTHLRLHNSTVLLAQDHDRVEINATAGETYWLQVRSGSDAGSSDIRPGFDRTGKYTVRISQPTSVAGGSGTDTTPGPLPGWGGVRGVTINLDGNGNGSSRGGINDPGQVDWYQIDGAKVGFMQVTVTGVNDDFHTEFVTAFRSNGGGIDTDTGEFDGDATVTFLVAAGERIIVAVSSLRGESTGTYTINVSQPTTAPTDDTPNDAANARDMSGELTPEGTGFIRRKIETPTDVDWFKIPVQGTGYMTTQVIPADGSSLPPKLELFRSSSFTTPFLTDDGLDGNTQISFVPAGSDDFIWAKVSSPSGNTGGYSLRTWRTDDPADDHPNASGPYGIPYTVTPQGSVTMSGEIGTAFDQDSFRILVQNPGLMMIDVISLTPGFTPFIHAAWQTPDHQGNSDTDGGSGRGGRAHLEIPSVMASPDNWINLDVRHPDGQTTKGQYLIRAWQPGSTADLDVNSIGPFATPIPVDSTGNGQLGVNLTDANAPAIDFTGDKDVFQVAAATGRPITFTVDSSAIANGTFLRVYDASGNAVATDNNSDPNGKSQITVDAKRGDLYYLEVSAFDGASLGKYTISTSQPTDDHPDAAVFGNQPGPAIPGVMPEVRRGCREPVLLEWCFGTLEGRGELGCDGCEC